MLISEFFKILSTIYLKPIFHFEFSKMKSTIYLKSILIKEFFKNRIDDIKHIKVHFEVKHENQQAGSNDALSFIETQKLFINQHLKEKQQNDLFFKKISQSIFLSKWRKRRC